jgi:transposase
MSKMHDYLNHGVLELDNNTAERSMRCVAMGRKNYLFVGSEGGGKAAAEVPFTLHPPHSPPYPVLTFANLLL